MTPAAHSYPCPVCGAAGCLPNGEQCPRCNGAGWDEQTIEEHDAAYRAAEEREHEHDRQ